MNFASSRLCARTCCCFPTDYVTVGNLDYNCVAAVGRGQVHVFGQGFFHIMRFPAEKFGEFCGEI